MEDKDNTHSSKLNRKSSSSSLHQKPISMSKIRRISTKVEEKKALVAFRLSMLDREEDELSNVGSVKEELMTPEPTPQPLAVVIKRATNIKGGSSQSRHKSSYSKSSAMKRAEEVQENLSAKHPSIVKYMLHSHIASGFWLGLPKKFCTEHLPSSDTVMELIDESGKISEAKYLASKNGLSGGWRAFSIDHHLKEGDVVVFHLVKSATFKVYIIRGNALGETDGASGLLSLGMSANVIISNDDEKESNEQHLDNFAPTIKGEEQEKILSDSLSSEDLGSEVLDWVKFSETDSVNLESFEKFSILLDGSVSIDTKFPDHIRRKYYNLCTQQNSSLHEKLLKGLNCTLVVGIINEIINIFDATRAEYCNKSDLMDMDRTLQSFELLGMNVGFIRMEIYEILGRALELEEANVNEVKADRELACEKMKSFEVKFLELRTRMEEIDEEIEKMEENTKRKRLKLREMVSSCDGFGSSLFD